MKLNTDYIRELLLYIEKQLDYTDKDSPEPKTHLEMTKGEVVSSDYFSTYNKQELSYALELLIKEKYVELAGNPKFDNVGNLIFAKIIGLSWQGHELLDNIRDDTIWNAVKKKASKFGGFSISSLFAGAKFLTSKLMSDPDAIQNFLKGIDNIHNMF